MKESSHTSQLNKPKVIAAIPAYNEANHIGGVILKAIKHVDEVIVVDDGSTDDTAQVSESAGAIVVRNGENLGAGRATGVCFQQARVRKADVLVTVDGDGQHDADEIPNIIGPVLDGEADLVIGSRFLGTDSNIPGYRRFGINIITFLLNFASGIKVSDSQSCFRAFSRKAIETLNITEKGFGFSVQLLIQARQRKLIIKEVPVSVIYHSDGSTLHPVVHGLGVAFSVIKLRIVGLLK